MNKITKQKIDQFIIFLIGTNAFIFLLLAYLGKLSTNPKDLVFIDFWDRLCVYSMWFTGYALYRKYLLEEGFFPVSSSWLLR